MKKRSSIRNVVLASAVLFPALSFSVAANAQQGSETNGSFSFTPIPSSVNATPGGNPDKPNIQHRGGDGLDKTLAITKK